MNESFPQTLVRAAEEKKAEDIVDRINQDHGPDTLFFGAQGVTREWKMRCGLRSPRYTTQWDELLVVS